MRDAVCEETTSRGRSRRCTGSTTSVSGSTATRTRGGGARTCSIYLTLWRRLIDDEVLVRRTAGSSPDVRTLEGAFYTLVPIRPRWRGERRSLRTFAGALSAHPSLSIPALGAFQLHLTPFNSTPTSLVWNGPQIDDRAPLRDPARGARSAT